MVSPSLSFVTPYLVGTEMMSLHLESIRRFYPDAPILVSTKAGSPMEMEDYRSRFGIDYWIEECCWDAAFGRLLRRCETEYVCVLDHDAILLSSLDPLLDGLMDNRHDLVGVEERVRVPDHIWKELWAPAGGWLRFAPGYMDATILIFNLRMFLRRWGLQGIRPSAALPPGYPAEPHYGLCERLRRHHYLRPYHARRYGLGNLLKNGETNVAWHSWYGSHRRRALGSSARSPGVPRDQVVRRVVEDAERAFLEDYPNLDLAQLEPAWWPDADIDAEKAAAAAEHQSGFRETLRVIRERALRWTRSHSPEE